MGMNTRRSFLNQEMNCAISEPTNRRFDLSIVKIVSVSMLFVLLIPVMAFSAMAEPIMYRHHIIMIQGDNPGTTEIELEYEIMAVERFFFLIPWNESRVEVSVPLNAIHESIDLDHVVDGGSMGYIPGEYSTFWNPNNPPFKELKDMEGMSCCIANKYVWVFPGGADRNFTVSTLVDTDSEFNQSFDRLRSDDAWNFSVSGMRLKLGKAFGDYISIPIEMGVNITKVEMTWNVSMHEENITFYISNNNGTDWMDMKGHEGEEMNFTAQGNELIMKINMTQNIGENNTPVLNGLWINVTYTPLYNDIILQLNYVVERESNKFEFILDLYEDDANFVTPHTIIYINKDHTLDSSGIPLELFESQTEFPDKSAYTFMSGSFTPEAKITIQSIEEEQFPWVLILALIAIVLIISILLIGGVRKKEISEPSLAQDTVAQDEEMEKLKHKKEGLLKAIKKLDTDFEEGLLDEEVYKELKSSYKSKAVDVMKQMDALVVSAASVAKAPILSQEKEALLQKKEKILKSIKKLDNDFNDGLLDEDVYKELRQSYKEKAVEVMKELEENR
ncbi:MAG: hypothetical protein V3U20_10950 [Thermoplasmata archaeon]